MARTVTSFFRTPREAEIAQRRLFEKGFSRNEVSFVAGDTRGHETPKVGPVLDSGAEVEAGRDAWFGGAVGLAAGAIAAVLPGIGPLIAFGPLAGAIGGAAVGAAAGGIIGLLKEHGVPEEEAQFYAEGVRRGGALLTVHNVSEEREALARTIFQQSGAVATEQLADEYGRAA
ncbi:MAG TPA: hypothetical protein VKB88_11055 [Bryobacteraceae bacterium]|nr:hypothetical protein [Bryobacteraceae bacterium]